MWYVSRIGCVICTNEWVAIYPVDADESRLECPSCGCEDSEIREYIPPVNIEHTAQILEVRYEFGADEE